MARILAALAGALLAWPAIAQVAGTGHALADALNKRDVEAILRTIDIEAVGRQVLKDIGLNATDREAMLRGFPGALRSNIEIGMRSIESSKGSAKFVRTGTANGRPYALVRFDLGENGTDYVAYYVTRSGKVEDWYTHSMAAFFSDVARMSLATLFKTDSVLFALFGTPFVTGSDTKPFTELRTHLQAQDFPAAYRALERFPENFRRTRQWAVMRATYGGRVDEATHRAALRHLAENFGKDADLALMLIDHYIFEQQMDRALQAVGALERAIGGEDGATGNLRGRILLMAKRTGEAASACRRGMAVEPEHKPAYWCLVEVGLETRSGRLTVEGLSAYEKAFSVEFDPERLAAMEPYTSIATTPEFAAWRKSRR